MIVIACGSRDWTDLKAVKDAFTMLWTMAQREFNIQKRALVTVATGGATGADMMAYQQAQSMGFLTHVEHANWRELFASAGPVRNRKLFELEPDLLLAFQKGPSRGTQDMLNLAVERNVRVICIYRDS